MAQPPPPTDLTELLDRLDQASRAGGKVSVGDLLAAVGRRSFGPVLMLAGLIVFSPLSGIPGLPTVMGFLVIVVCGQLLARRDHFWVPRWVLRRSVSRTALAKAVRFLRKPARGIDHLLRERVSVLVEGPVTYGIAFLSLLIAAMMPPLEFIPFASSVAGAALATFGLALTARDGVVAIVALLFTALTGYAAGQSLLGD